MVVFHRQEVLERLEGDEELLRELVHLFLEQSHEQLRELKSAVAVGDAAGIRHQAHSLKGAAAGLGAQSLSHAAAQLELAGKQGRLGQAPELLRLLEAELERFAQAVTL